MIKKNEQPILEEFMRWREGEGSELANLKLEFFAHLQKSHPELISGLNIPSSQQYQIIASIVSKWERLRK
jgi:hypothetical protein